MANNYIGLTYPDFLQWKFVRRLWQKYMCPRKMHLFDEVLSDEHYLVCDACGFAICITHILDRGNRPIY